MRRGSTPAHPPHPSTILASGSHGPLPTPLARGGDSAYLTLMSPRIARLDSRALIRVAGPDARPFLHNLLTQDVETLAEGELRFGARKRNAPLLTARIERLLQAIEVLPFDGDVDRAYAEVRAMLEALGRPSGANDMLIAAHAVNEDCILVTNNESEFIHVAGLVVENWLES